MVCDKATQNDAVQRKCDTELAAAAILLLLPEAVLSVRQAFQLGGFRCYHRSIVSSQFTILII